MNYEQLFNTIQSYAQNTESTFLAYIPTFIQECEERVYNSVQFPSLRSNKTGTLTASNQYLSLPNDYLSTYSLAIIDPITGNYTYLLNKDVNFIREAYPSAAYQGQPKHYAIFGPQSTNESYLTFIVGPTPNIAYNAELHYYYYPTSIIQAAISTLTITNAGSGYTNGTYYNVTLTGGTGNSATATIVVSGNIVTSVTLIGKGCYYAVGDTLSATIAGGTGLILTVTAINNANGETWVGDNFDSALLNGTLYEAITYVKGDADMQALYKDRYVQAMALLKNLGDGKLRMDAYRDGQVRIPVS